MKVKGRNKRLHLHVLLLTIAILHRCIVGLRVWSGISKAVELQMQPSQWKASTTTSEQVREQNPVRFLPFSRLNLKSPP